MSHENNFFRVGELKDKMSEAVQKCSKYIKGSESACEQENEIQQIKCDSQIRDMEFKTLTRGESSKAMDEWIKNKFQMPKVNSEYLLLRKDIQDIYSKVKTESVGIKNKKEYFTDVKFGLYLYDYFRSMSGFNMRCAADDDFWRYLCVKAVPDVVGERWGYANEDHYWKKPTRIWLRCIWWYIHLSWQGNSEKTERLLMSKCFDTDTILNLEERTGREGTFIDVSRLIMKKFAEVMKNRGQNPKRTRQENPFRIIMKLNTAKIVVIEPALYEGGEKGYVDSLFEDVGVI